ncbi:MAG TPA: Crp/Fnr family transcriptional regulator [Blastocatellia bacterium]|nr:Crp/Fnr family transcriptional regulator [Blastocatellia bacterium]
MNFEQFSSPISNGLLNTLPRAEYRQILPYLKLVKLERGEIIHPAQQVIDYVYFPLSGLISMLVSAPNGDMIEASIYGNEAIISLPAFLGDRVSLHQVEVQIPGAALRMKAYDFKKFCRLSATIRKKLSYYSHLMIEQLSQTILCNSYHSVEQRLCRWLLTARDRISSDYLPLTRDVLATMTGARRPRISTILTRLAARGLIQSSRGVIKIVDPEGLEELSCECYRILKTYAEEHSGKR